MVKGGVKPPAAASGLLEHRPALAAPVDSVGGAKRQVWDKKMSCWTDAPDSAPQTAPECLGMDSLGADRPQSGGLALKQRRHIQQPGGEDHVTGGNEGPAVSGIDGVTHRRHFQGAAEDHLSRTGTAPATAVESAPSKDPADGLHGVMHRRHFAGAAGPDTVGRMLEQMDAPERLEPEPVRAAAAVQEVAAAPARPLAAPPAPAAPATASGPGGPAATEQDARGLHGVAHRRHLVPPGGRDHIILG